jgi:hypothetical protein
MERAPSKRQDNPIVQCFIGILLVWAFVHTIRTRSADDFWWHSLTTGAAIGSIFLVVFAVIWFKRGLKVSLTEALASVFAVPAGLMLLGMVYYAVGASAKDLFLWARDPSTLSWRAVAASLLVLATGSLLFYFRLHYRSLYGATEALVGVLVAMQRVLSTPGGSPRLDVDLFLPLLTASIYLVVRGFDNVHQGLTKDPLDPAAAAILTWIRTRSRAANESRPSEVPP